MLLALDLSSYFNVVYMNNFERSPLNLPVFHCLRCHNEWIPRKMEVPGRCGKCKNRAWNRFPKDFDPITTDCRTCQWIYKDRNRNIASTSVQPKVKSKAKNK